MELRSTKKMKIVFGNIIYFEMINLCYLLVVLLACLQGRGHDTLESVWPVVVHNFETVISSP